MYPQEELYEEITFIAYYLHWGADDILHLPHKDRRRFCGEISAMHEGMTRLPINPLVVD